MREAFCALKPGERQPMNLDYYSRMALTAGFVVEDRAVEGRTFRRTSEVPLAAQRCFSRLDPRSRRR